MTVNEFSHRYKLQCIGFNIRQDLLCCNITHLGCSKGLLYRNVIIEYKIRTVKISMNIFHGEPCRNDDYSYVYW